MIGTPILLVDPFSELCYFVYQISVYHGWGRKSMPKPFTRNEAIAETIQSLRRIFKAIQDYSQEVSQEFGITGPQLWALKTIYAEESLSLSELSKKMYLHPSTVTGVVDRLEKKGYVFRDRGQEDRRVVKVQLTPSGKQLVKKAPNPVQGKMIYGLRKMNQGELEKIHEAVEKLVEIAEAKNVKATFFFDQE
jgi:MarR family transcriptional regulator, organic hydroperoxide resistance regulator